MIRDYVAIDLEMSGLSAKNDKIIEVGLAKVIDGQIVDQYETLVNPKLRLSEEVTRLTGITDEMLVDKPVIDKLIGDIVAFIGDLPLLGHNVIYDYSFIKKACVNNKITFEKYAIDTLKLSRLFHPELEKKNLGNMLDYYGLNDGKEHRALYDAIKAHELYLKLMEHFSDREEDFKLIKLNYSVKKDQPIAKSQIVHLNNLLKYHKIKSETLFQCEIKDLTQSQASRIVDKIISTYGKPIKEQ